MKMRRTELFRPSLLLALVVVVAGCQETTGPGALSQLATAAALADYNAMDGVLQSSGWRNFQMTAAKMDVAKVGFAPAVAARAGEAMQALAAGRDTRSFAAAMANIASSMNERGECAAHLDLESRQTFVPQRAAARLGC
jgi:hypothetical protein